MILFYDLIYKFKKAISYLNFKKIKYRFKYGYWPAFYELPRYPVRDEFRYRLGIMKYKIYRIKCFIGRLINE